VPHVPTLIFVAYIIRLVRLIASIAVQIPVSVLTAFVLRSLRAIALGEVRKAVFRPHPL
jgi:hypothetical protein